MVRTWEGYRQEEMQVKAQKNAPRLCPVCIQERIRTRLGIAHLTVQDMLPQAAPPPPAVCQEVLL